jgi:hypothetical protein
VAVPPVDETREIGSAMRGLRGVRRCEDRSPGSHAFGEGFVVAGDLLRRPGACSAASRPILFCSKLGAICPPALSFGIVAGQ